MINERGSGFSSQTVTSAGWQSSHVSFILMNDAYLKRLSFELHLLIFTYDRYASYRYYVFTTQRGMENSQHYSLVVFKFIIIYFRL